MGNILRRALAAAALTISAAGGVLAASVPAAHAATQRNVPGDYPTIQAAIDAAFPYDTIEVLPGTYHEHITFPGFPITVESVGGPAETTIDGGGAGSVVTFNSTEDESSVLRGFTITHGLDAGVQVLSSPTITDNRIVNNGYCTGGGGIYVGGSVIDGSYVGGAPKIRHNVIADNGATGCSGGNSAGGIALINAGHADVSENQITGNTASSGGSGVTVNQSRAYVANNVIAGNRSANAFVQPGVWLLDDTGALVAGNLIVDNPAGLYLFDASLTSGPSVVNNTIARNGGAAFIGNGGDTGPHVTNNIFATPSGDAVICNPNAAWFDHNLAFSASGTAWSGCNPTGTNGNLSADPRFVDASSNPGDFHLAASSPAIDTGENFAQYPDPDIDGNHRPTDGDADGSPVVDLGAYETAGAQITSTTTVVTSSANPSVTGAAVVLRASVRAPNGHTPTGTVQFRDGSSNLGSPIPLVSGAASLNTSALAIGSHPISAAYAPNDPEFLASTSDPLVQQVGYGTEFVYNTDQLYKVGTNVHIKVELHDASGANISPPAIAVTAACVVPLGGSCADQSAVAINQPFTFHKKDKGQSFYDYEVRTKGMAPGTYDVVFTAAGDPIQHRAPLLLKK